MSYDYQSQRYHRHILGAQCVTISIIDLVIACLWIIIRKRKRSDSVLWQKPLHQQKCRQGKVTTQTTPQKKFDNTAIADRLRTVSWSNYGQPTDVVNRFTCPTFPTISWQNCIEYWPLSCTCLGAFRMSDIITLSRPYLLLQNTTQVFIHQIALHALSTNVKKGVIPDF